MTNRNRFLGVFFFATMTSCLTAFSQSQPDDSADTSGALAAIQAKQNAASVSTQPQQAFPALKAKYCKEAVAYVEDKNNGLLHRWDVDMHNLKTDRFGALAKIAERKDLLDVAYWYRTPIFDVANEVRLLSKMTLDELALLEPGGDELKLGIQISEDFGAEVSRRSIKVYKALKVGDNANEVLRSSTDELVVWALKEEAAKAGAGRLSAAFDIVQAIQERNKTTDELANSRAFVQEKVKELDVIINQLQNDLQEQREDLLATEALKDAVQAACNEGEPKQSVPEFASGYVQQQPAVQEASSSEADSLQQPIKPWWAMLSSIHPVVIRATRPTQSVSRPGQAASPPPAQGRPSSTDGVGPY